MAEHIYGLFENDTNKRLIEHLKKRQANLRLFPDVKAIAPALEPAAAPDFDLSAFDWIVFPDLYSVDFFLANVPEKFALDELTVCALGDSISDRLRFSQLHADIIPPDRQTRHHPFFPHRLWIAIGPRSFDSRAPGRDPGHYWDIERKWRRRSIITGL